MELSLYSTGDIRLFQTRHYKSNARGHCHILKSICDIGDPPVKVPIIMVLCS